MLTILSRYAEPIIQACLVFPIVAALFTLPFMILNYRKYGGIALMRVIVVYSFILYSMCAFLLTVLPLPSRAAVAATPPRPIGWIPFTDLTVGMQRKGLLFSDPSTLKNLAAWKSYLRSSDFFQIVANVVMQIPLGFYLRYYFRCSLKKTILIGFFVSLFYETTQYTGLFFLYPHAYRYASVDDLINNTLGAVVGYGITPLIALILPTREDIDRISYSKGRNITLLRRMLAAVLDMMLFGTLLVLGFYFARRISAFPTTAIGASTFPFFLLYFVCIPRITHGRSPGHALLKLRVVQESTHKSPTLFQLFIRYFLLYIVEPFLAFMAMFALVGLVITLTSQGLEFEVTALLLVGCISVLLGVMVFFINSQLRWGAFPHGHFSHTVVIQNSEV